MRNPIICNVSGGLSSIEALERAIQFFGKECIIPVFADVGSVVEKGRVVCGEDEDLIRFMGDAERYLGVNIHRIKHPKYSNIWECFFGERYLGNDRIDTCSKFLKREVIKEYVKQFNNPTQVIGFSWMEKSRVDRFRAYNPHSWFPLCEKPYVTNDEIAEKWEARGIKRSRSYSEGFSHDNCGGMCVKMGLGQAYQLWLKRPWRYEYAQRREAEFRAKINPSITIFQRNGVRVTMLELHFMFRLGYVPKSVGSESCGGRCMLPEIIDDAN